MTLILEHDDSEGEMEPALASAKPLLDASKVEVDRWWEGKRETEQQERDEERRQSAQRAAEVALLASPPDAAKPKRKSAPTSNPKHMTLVQLKKTLRQRHIEPPEGAGKEELVELLQRSCDSDPVATPDT